MDNTLRISLALAIAVASQACVEGHEGARNEAAIRAKNATVRAIARTNETAYTQIGGSGALSRSVSLCELLHFYTAGAGRYTVQKIVGYTEELKQAPGHFDG